MPAFYVDVSQTSSRTYKVEHPDVKSEEDARAMYVDHGSLVHSETTPEEVTSVSATAEGV